METGPNGHSGQAVAFHAGLDKALDRDPAQTLAPPTMEQIVLVLIRNKRLVRQLAALVKSNISLINSIKNDTEIEKHIKGRKPEYQFLLMLVM